MGADMESYMILSPARLVLGRRKQREMDVFDQQEELDPKTSMQPRRRSEAPPDMQMEMETEVEMPTAAENEAIVVSQLENLSRELRKFSDHHIWGRRTTEIAYTIAKKLMPEIIEAGEKQHAGGNADSSRTLQKTAELCLTVKNLAKAVNALVVRQEAIPTQKGENLRGPKEVQGVTTVIAKPLEPPQNTRSNKAKHLCVASAHYNYNQNLVIMLREDQKGEELRQHADEFVDIFGVPAHTIEMLTDDRRFKVRINGVWTGRDGKNDTHTPEDLLEEIERFNPIMLKVTLMGKPRWMRAEADLRREDYSSVVLEFAKEEDAKTVLGARYIAMYTNFCEVIHHADKPPVLQCSNCWALGHHASRCKNPMRCRICAGRHSEMEHRHVETQRMQEGEEGDGQEEMNTNKCANCGGDHPATERSCLERKRYQMIVREKEGGAIEGGATVRKRKGRRGREGRQEMEGDGKRKEVRQQNDETTRGGTPTTGMAAGARSASQSGNTGTERGANRFMALENLLNEEGRIDWAEEEAMEGQETTERQTDDKFDIILVTEPWWGEIGNGQRGPAALGAWIPIPPTATIPAERRPRVMAYAKRRQDFTITLRSDLAKDLDIQVLDISQANYPTVTIVNIYNQPKSRN
ncbi:hypothetical protein C0992_000907 [Termitomyces sp. T32_za158]|nr:hypothetical protein C0992_000907 [Termitomyces sp. T32_za158]